MGGHRSPRIRESCAEPVYNFDMDAKIFCDLVELCLGYNQFKVEGSFYRQIHGLFMGSSISPPLAQMYMEYFESELYEEHIPHNIKPTEWRRFVDDVFIIYEHSEEDFTEFFDKLNTLDSHINFTFERSISGEEAGLPSEVCEVLPFLDLKVVRYFDRNTNAISNKLLIHRKDCHSGSYIHFLSSQPTSIKRAVIRNMFLRAYRYCDPIFLKAEERKIYDDFTSLGYNVKFITKANISAKEGRNHELRLIRENASRPPRERSKIHINLPFQNASRGLGYRLKQLGVDLTYSNRNTLIRRITRGDKRQVAGGVYIMECTNSDCKRVYVGQAQNIPKRFNDHRLAISRDDISYTTVNHSKLRGHDMDISNGITAFESDSMSHRLVVETSLIHVCNTVRGNKSTTSTRDIDLLAPMILKGAPLNWTAIARVQPHTFKPNAIPRRHLKLFKHNSNVSGPSPVPDPPTIETSQVTRHSYYLRSQGSLDTSSIGN